MKKFLVLMLASVLVLSACGTSSKKKELTIAVPETYIEYFTELATEFTKDKDYKIKVIETDMLKLLEALPTQKGNSADIFMMPNDGIGDNASQKIIKPVSVSLDNYSENAKVAANFNGENYMLPMSAETTLLIYNTEKVTELPKTLKEIDPKDWAAKFTDFYFAAGLFHGFGGYIFKDNDPTKIGLNTPESVKAGEAIKSLYASGVSHWSLMKDDTIAYETAMKAFTSGEIKYLINGPWALSDIDKAGIKFDIMPIPNWDETTSYKPLVGTKGLGVNAYTQFPEEADAFLTFVSSKENAAKWHEMTKEVSPHTGVVYEEGSVYAKIFEATTKGLSMPNIPAFAKVWVPMADALKQIASGQDVQKSLDAAVTTITNEVATMK